MKHDEKLAGQWSLLAPHLAAPYFLLLTSYFLLITYYLFLLGPHLLRRSVQGCMDAQNIRPHVPDLPDHLRTLPAWRPRNANVSS